jgi:hypothetical protein
MRVAKSKSAHISDQGIIVLTSVAEPCHFETVPDQVTSVADPDPEISPPNPDPDPALVVKKKISIPVQYCAYVYLFTP